MNKIYNERVIIIYSTCIQLLKINLNKWKVFKNVFSDDKVYKTSSNKSKVDMYNINLNFFKRRVSISFLLNKFLFLKFVSIFLIKIASVKRNYSLLKII